MEDGKCCNSMHTFAHASIMAAHTLVMPTYSFPWSADKYVKVLEELKRQFSAAQRAEDTSRMKRFATTLQLFQEGYHKLIEMFVEECLPPVSWTQQHTYVCMGYSQFTPLSSPLLPSLPSPPSPLLPLLSPPYPTPPLHPLLHAHSRRMSPMPQTVRCSLKWNFSVSKCVCLHAHSHCGL